MSHNSLALQFSSAGVSDCKSAYGITAELTARNWPTAQEYQFGSTLSFAERHKTAGDYLLGDEATTNCFWLHQLNTSACWSAAQESFATWLAHPLRFLPEQDTDHRSTNGSEIIEDILTIFQNSNAHACEKRQEKFFSDGIFDSLSHQTHEPAASQPNTIKTVAVLPKAENDKLDRGADPGSKGKTMETDGWPWSVVCPESKEGDSLPTVQQPAIHFATNNPFATSTSTAEHSIPSQLRPCGGPDAASTTIAGSCHRLLHEARSHQGEEIDKTQPCVLTAVQKDLLRRRRARAEKKARRLRKEALLEELRKENAALRQQQEILQTEIACVKKQLLRKSERGSENKKSEEGNSNN